MQKTVGLIFLSLLLVSCGEFSYKRGASGQDLADTKKVCQSESLKSDAEVNDCLKKNGWTVHQLNDMDLFAVASVTSNQQNKTTTEKSPSIEDSKAEPANATEKTTVESTGETPLKSQVKSANPLDIYNISSWWKVGSSRASLETDMQSCETALGEAHKPDQKNQTFTLGMIVCMHEKGWKALRK